MLENTERISLGFQDTVREYFAFIENQYGFRCVSSDLYCVKYTSDKAYLHVYHERISFELYFVVGMLPESCNNPLKADTRDFIAMDNDTERSLLYQASKKEGVRAAVEELAELAGTHAVDALSGSPQFYEDIANSRTKRQEIAMRLHQLETADQKAGIAWDNRDYKRVVELYTPYEPHLRPVQIKKLNIARKKLTSL
jgi:hypothetical protein